MTTARVWPHGEKTNMEGKARRKREQASKANALQRTER